MKSRNKFTRIVCVALAVIMLVSLVSTALIMLVNAASSKEIEKELVDLRAQQAELKKQSDALKAEINQNEAETQTLIEKKADIDRQMDVSRQTIENLNEQIQQYSLLIAEKQTELESSLAEEEALNEQYKARLRSMEETGSISYWSILFGARSFSDLLDKVAMIHSLDSIKLAEEIEKRAAAIDRVMPCLVQVNIADEDTKFGLMTEETADFVKEISRFPHISVEGLMTIGPHVDDEERIRSVFQELRELKEQIASLALPTVKMRELSMGMSSDYPLAVREGATMVRVGTTIFGPRS